MNDRIDGHRRTTGRHGIDIASGRIDDLDRLCLRDILSGEIDEGIALDIGCGNGYHGLRMAALGCRTVLIDLLDLRDRVRQMSEAFPGLPLEAYCGRVQDFLAAHQKKNVALCYSQRMIHYVPFAEAVSILRHVRSLLTAEARVYISASGLDSELGVGYRSAASDVRNRFAPLDPEMAARHSILEDLCLYTEADMTALAGESGLIVSRLWTSDFGNLKAVLRPDR